MFSGYGGEALLLGAAYLLRNGIAIIRPAVHLPFLVILVLVELGSRLSLAALPEAAAFTGRWFAPNSPFNVTIGAAHDTEYSSAAIRMFIQSGKRIDYDQDLWTSAVIYTDGVYVTRADLHYSWGQNNNWVLKKIPLPPDLLTYAKWVDNQRWMGKRLDGDGRVCLYDASLKGFFSLWNTSPDPSGQTVQVKAGGFNPENGPGASTGGGAAAKTSYCAGLIRPNELASGKIEHALQMVWPVKLVRAKSTQDSMVYPATFTDGGATDTNGTVPMGARLQLNPKLSEPELRKLGLESAGDIAIAHALQTYGGYIVDTGPGAGIMLQNAFGQGESLYGPIGAGKYGFAVNRYVQPELISQLRFVEPPAPVHLDSPEALKYPLRE
jgi:hypothetical protein